MPRKSSLEIIQPFKIGCSMGWQNWQNIRAHRDQTSVFPNENWKMEKSKHYCRKIKLRWSFLFSVNMPVLFQGNTPRTGNSSRVWDVVTHFKAPSKSLKSKLKIISQMFIYFYFSPVQRLFPPKIGFSIKKSYYISFSKSYKNMILFL